MSKSSSEIVSNRRAFHDYEVLDTYEAGIVLLGTEIKSLRNHGGSLQDAYVDIKGQTPWLINCSIAPYAFGSIHNHEERRARQLLLHKREIEQLRKKTAERGFALIPLAIFLNKDGFAKVRIGIAKGKKAYDKRESLKERESNRSMERARKGEERD